MKTNLPKNWWRSNTATAEEVFNGTQLNEASETASYDWRTSIGNDQYIYANLTTTNASSSTSSAKHWLISPQIDLAANQKSGLRDAMERFDQIKGISIIRFDEKDIVRHPLVKRIVAAYE